MAELRSRMPVKIAGVVIYTVSLEALVCSVIAVIVALDAGMYDQGAARIITYPTEYTGTMQSVMQFIFQNRFILIGVAAVSLLVMLASLAFLCSAAGRRRDVEGITLNMLDKIWLEPLSFAYGMFSLISVAFCMWVGNSFHRNVAVIISLVMAITLFVGLPALALILTLATRIKHGQLRQGLATYRLLNAAWRDLRWAFRALPLVWRAVVVFAAALFVEFILLIFCIDYYYSGLVLLLLVGFEMLLLAGVLLCAVNLNQLRAATQRMAGGDFSQPVDTTLMFWDFKGLGENLNRVRVGTAAAIEQQLKAERLKTELITNVSHDIKTPLTSIVNYVDLLSKEPLDKTAAEYLEVLERQARRLQALSEDLVEAAKASTGNIPVNLAPTDIKELITQALGEHSDRLAESQLTPVVSLPEAKAQILADSQLIWRAIDNLLSNAARHALPGTRLYVDVLLEGGSVKASFKNISREPLNVSAEELTERFVRGDASRTGEGSGLGLNIAQSLVTLQGGQLAVTIDGDLFKAEISFPAIGLPVWQQDAPPPAGTQAAVPSPAAAPPAARPMPTQAPAQQAPSPSPAAAPPSASPSPAAAGPMPAPTPPAAGPSPAQAPAQQAPAPPTAAEQPS